jgi:hypothetical protein
MSDLQKAVAAYSVNEFCATHRISLAFYYRLKRAGAGPKEMLLGRKRLISTEAAAAWRRAREDAAI